jgi:hypothetical protein
LTSTGRFGGWLMLGAGALFLSAAGVGCAGCSSASSGAIWFGVVAGLLGFVGVTAGAILFAAGGGEFKR